MANILIENTKVDSTVFNKYNITFNHNVAYTSSGIEIAFELSNTKAMAKVNSSEDDLTIKANLYDASGKIISVKQYYVSYDDLKSNYVSASIVFFGENISLARSLKIYAIDPANTFDDDFGVESNATKASELLHESLIELDTTKDLKTFLFEYDKSLTLAQTIVAELVNNTNATLSAFVQRCNQGNMLPFLKNELEELEKKHPESPVVSYLNKIIQEIENN